MFMGDKIEEGLSLIKDKLIREEMLILGKTDTMKRLTFTSLEK